MSLNDETNKRTPQSNTKYYAFGMQIAVSFAFYVLGGYWLDTKFSTLPLFLILGMVFGFISFIYFMRKLYRRK